MTLVEAVIAVVIVIGLLGIVVPILPGSLLIGAAIAVWAFDTTGTTAWLFAAGCFGVLLAGAVVSYLIPGRRLKRTGIATSTLLTAAALGVVGFFVIPIIGLPIGFVAGIYLVELSRNPQQRDQAWPRTQQALKAVGISIAIEFTAALAATSIWVAGVIAT